MKHINESIIGGKTGTRWETKKYILARFVWNEAELVRKGVGDGNFNKFDKWMGKIESKQDYSELVSCLGVYDSWGTIYEGNIYNRQFIMKMWDEMDKLIGKDAEYICGLIPVEEEDYMVTNAKVIFINAVGRTFYLYKK